MPSITKKLTDTQRLGVMQEDIAVLKEKTKTIECHITNQSNILEKMSKKIDSITPVIAVQTERTNTLESKIKELDARFWFVIGALVVGILGAVLKTFSFI
jgi:chromosome segregation ATPase